MDTQDKPSAAVPDGLHVVEAEFYTENLVIRGEMTIPETRLSDHLNSNASSVDIRPFHVEQLPSRRHIDLPGAFGHLTKAHLLFVLPLSEPQGPPRAMNEAWEWKMTRRCWGAVGRYSLVAKVQSEAGRDPRVILRSLEEKQFLPLNEVAITFPDNVVRDYPTVIVNRYHLELLAITGLSS